MRHLPVILIYGYVGCRQIDNLFFNQLIGIDETDAFQLKFCI